MCSWRVLVGVVALTAALCGCSSSAVDTLSAGDWKLGDAVGPWIVGGVLRVDGDGCLYLPPTAHRVGRQDIVWPAGFTSRTSDDGSVSVLDSQERVVAMTGKPFAAKGSWTLDDDLSSQLGCRSNTDGSVVVVESELPPLADWYTADSQVVTLWHCGVNPAEFEGKLWATVDARFDQDNIPRAFVGRGTMVRRGSDEAVYTDESGVKMTFVPADTVHDAACA